MKYFNKYSIVSAWIILLSLYSCSNFEEINTNPNATEKVTPGMIATTQIMSLVRPGAAKPFAQNNLLSKQLAWGESADGNQYNNFGRTSLSDIISLVDLQKMVNYSTDANRDAYTGLALFIKAYKMFYLSMSLGDIPYSEAAMGESGNITPKYDTQKDVILQTLKDLNDAETHLSVAKNFDGDPLYKGDVTIWRRINNSFRLKVLMFLSKKENDADLNIKATFNKIVKELPILTNSNQSLQLVFSNKAGQIYPINKVNNNHYSYGILSDVLVDILKKRNDYRLFYFGEPSAYAVNTLHKAVDDWDAYPGIDPSMRFDDLKVLYTAGKYCGFNNRYILYEPGEPIMRVGYIEQNFIIAEGIIRGWTTGDAGSYYNEGIKAAMRFMAANTPATYRHNRDITESYISDYLVNPQVAFGTTSDQQLKQIWTQKYILYFLQHPWDSYYEYRRTGYPVLPINPNTNLNEVKDKIPTRWMYPQNEYNMNLKNLSEALDRQYNGQDKVNDLMWILQ